MKRLFNFTLEKKEVVDVVETTTNEKNEQVTITKKEEQSIPNKFFLRKPSRIMIEDGKLFYGVKFAEAIKAGLLPMSLLSKRFANDAGVLSEPEKAHYANLYITLSEKKNELDKLTADKENDNKDKKDKLMEEITTVYREIQDLEVNQANLFSNTAESFARDRTATWWTIQLSHKEDKDGKIAPVFGTETDEYNKRLDIFDEMFDKDDAENFDKKLTTMFIYLTMFWFTGKANTEEDFKAAWEMVKNGTI